MLRTNPLGRCLVGGIRSIAELRTIHELKLRR
jgi:hypothetical protein